MQAETDHVRGNNLVCVYWPCSNQRLFAARWMASDQTQGNMRILPPYLQMQMQIQIK